MKGYNICAGQSHLLARLERPPGNYFDNFTTKYVLIKHSGVGWIQTRKRKYRVGHLYGYTVITWEWLVILKSCLWHISICEGANSSRWVVTMVAI